MRQSAGMLPCLRLAAFLPALWLAAFLSFSFYHAGIATAFETARPGVGKRYDINSASRTQLSTVPGISPDLADIVILYRELKEPFRDIEHFFSVINALPEEREVFSGMLEVRHASEETSHDSRDGGLTSENSKCAGRAGAGAGARAENYEPEVTEGVAPRRLFRQNGGPGKVEIPVSPSGPDSFRFCVISDSNSTYGSIRQGTGVNAAVRSIIERLRPDLVIHNGDMVAGQKKSIGAERLEEMWDEYFRVVADPLAKASIPLVPVGGNHDASPGFKDRDVFVRRWSEMERVPGLDFSFREGYPLFYSFNFRGASFVILGAVNGHMSSAEVETTRKLLENSNGKPLFVFNHVPFEKLYDRNHGRLAPEDKIYGLFINRGVNLLFTSHYELYFRGFYKALPVVSTGVIAGVDRKIMGSNRPQGMSFVVVDVAGGEPVRVFAVKGPGFDSVFDESELPEAFGNYRRFDCIR